MKRAVIVLFAAGISLARVAWGQNPQPLIPDQGQFAGRPAWRTGLTMVVIGGALAAFTYALGG